MALWVAAAVTRSSLHSRVCVCRYAVLGPSGTFSHWEKLPGTADSRTLICNGKAIALDDVFGEVCDLNMNIANLSSARTRSAEIARCHQ